MLGLYLASMMIPGVQIVGTGSFIIAAVLLGLVNAFVRPIAFLLTLPITIVTLGLFLLVLNAAMLGKEQARLDIFWFETLVFIEDFLHRRAVGQEI